MSGSELVYIDKTVGTTLQRTEVEPRAESLGLAHLASVLREQGYRVTILQFLSTQEIEIRDAIIELNPGGSVSNCV